MTKETILIRCPSCRFAKKRVPREPYDPALAVTADILCPKCCDATCALEPPTFYFDADGNEINGGTP